MRKEIVCSECNSVKSSVKVCDVCGYQLREFPICELGKRICDIPGNPITLNIEDNEYDFCSLKCVSNFIIAELTKEK